MAPKLRRFFREWLDYGEAGQVFKDAAVATSKFEEPRSTDRFHPGSYSQRYYRGDLLADELDEVIARALFEEPRASGRGDLAELLTTRRFLVRPAADLTHLDRNEQYRNAPPYKNMVYNVDYDDSGPIADTLEERWITMPEEERAGVLTHPAWLAAHGHNFENDASPVRRGKWVFQNLLCGWLDELPIGVEAQLREESKEPSARHRVGIYTDPTREDRAGYGNDFCANCHGSMNPFGYAFEAYNHAGFVRAHDRGWPGEAWPPKDGELVEGPQSAPDGSATLQFTPIQYVDDGKVHAILELTPGESQLRDGMTVSGAPKMMEAFARSEHVKQCFVRQSFRFFAGRDETRADACTLAEMESAYDQRGSMVDMLVAYFTSDTFLYRHVPTDGEEAAR